MVTVIVTPSARLEWNKANLLRQPTAWYCSHLLLSAGRAAIDISWPPGPQQQTNRSGVRRPNDGKDGQTLNRQTDRRTDARQFHKPCSAYHASSVNKCRKKLILFHIYLFVVNVLTAAVRWNCVQLEKNCRRSTTVIVLTNTNANPEPWQPTTLIFNPRRAMVMTQTHAQRSVVRVETGGRTRPILSSASLTRFVINPQQIEVMEWGYMRPQRGYGDK